ncbi:MAG: SulP family inorganic anion transporter, partial [Clostridiales bacterium]|nr:SulP family inorganic anion transporter [Clostridiales bacterium]
SMGYAQVSGLPMQYGLYASLIPILIYGLLSSTRNFVFGVDAAPAALVGGALVTMGIALGSDEAIKTVPVITTMVAAWLLLFFFLRAGRIVKYISTPVMGGFVTGICVTIILMQIPKLMGGDPGTGEAVELIADIIGTIPDVNIISLLLGLGTVIIIVVMSRVAPKIPMPVIIMVAGFILTKYLKIDQYGVKLLPHVDRGLPMPVLPDFRGEDITPLLFTSLSIALVIMAETLLASRSVVMKEGGKIIPQREILAYSLGNFASALAGSCPVNGSVSRSALSRQFGATSHIMSVTASAAMVLVLLFLTPYIEFLPVPVLTGIVIAALINACEFDLMIKLFKNSRQEFWIFISAFLGVLIFGTVYGVIIGVVLSFVAVIIKAVVPPKGFMGMVPGHDRLVMLSRYKDAVPLKDTLIYRFGGNLFFANIDTFENDIEKNLKPSTGTVIVYAVGIGDIDMTAAERLTLLNKQLEDRGIKFYITDHQGHLNDQLRAFGAGELLHNGTVRRTFRLALRDAGIHHPYPLENGKFQGEDKSATDDLTAELEWVFGKENVDRVRDRMSKKVLNEISQEKDITAEDLEIAEEHLNFGKIGLLDEEEILNIIEARLADADSLPAEQKEAIRKAVSDRRSKVEKRIGELSPRALNRLKK